MKYYVYILKSEERGGYYIGQTKEPPEERLEKHNSGYYGDKKYTYRDRPWSLFHIIICETETQSKLIEKHIKKMKSRKYIENLANYPEMNKKLLEKYRAADS